MFLHRLLMSKFRIQGTVSKGFEPVKELFEKNFIKRTEENAQLCAYINGERVVDLAGSIHEESNYNLDSLATVFSSTKNLTSIGIATLVDKGLLHYDDQVAKHWPEYGEADQQKESITIADVLRHNGGMPAFSETIQIAAMQKENIKANAIGKIVEKEYLRFPGQSRTFYHAITRGCVLNEIFRRIDPAGRTIGEWLREDLSAKLNVDAYIGLEYEELSKSVDMTWKGPLYVFSESLKPKFLGRKVDPSLFEAIKTMATVIPEMLSVSDIPTIEKMARDAPEMLNLVDLSTLKTGEMPSFNGQCSARGLAKIAAMMANKGRIEDTEVLSENTWNTFHSECQRNILSPFRVESNFSQGGVNYFDQPGTGIFKNNKHKIGFYGWQGFGGSIFQWHPQKRIGFAYVPTFLLWEDMTNTKGSLLQRSVVECFESM